MDQTLQLIYKATILLAAGLIAAALLRNSNPRWRIFSCQLAALAVIALPLFVLSPFAISMPIGSVSQPASLPPTPFENTVSSERTIQPASAPITAPISAAGSAQSASSGNTLPSLKLCLWGTYLCGAALLLGCHALGRKRLRRAMANYAEPEPPIRKRFDHIVREFNFARQPKLRIAEPGTSPFCCQLEGGTVIVPDGLLDTETEELVLRHELHHLANHDLHRSTFMSFVAMLLWFHPFAWMLRRSHSMAIEELGDRVASGKAGSDSRERYRSILARLALDLQRPRFSAPTTLGLFRTPQIVTRLRRLGTDVSHRPVGLLPRVLTVITLACPALLALSVLKVTAADTENEIKQRPSLIESLPEGKQKAAKDSVDAAMKFLLANEIDGGGFRNKVGDKASYETPTTALAGLAFLAHGGAAKDSQHNATLLRCVDTVLAAQDKESGMFVTSAKSEKKSFGSIYEQATAANFLARALHSANPKRQANIRWSLTKILDVLVKAQAIEKVDASKGGWRYSVKSQDSDLSCTVWVLRALYAIDEAGIAVPKKVFTEADAYVERSQSEDGGFKYTPNAPSTTASLTAAGLYSLQKSGNGDSPAAKQASQRLIELVAESPKAFGFYRFLWASTAALERGGEDAKKIATHMVEYCSARQEKDGSWKAAHGEILGTIFVLMAYGAAE